MCIFDYSCSKCVCVCVIGIMWTNPIITPFESPQLAEDIFKFQHTVKIISRVKRKLQKTLNSDSTDPHSEKVTDFNIVWHTSKSK